MNRSYFFFLLVCSGWATAQPATRPATPPSSQTVVTKTQPDSSQAATTQPPSLTVVHKAPEAWMKAQIKSVSEFIQRFDYEKTPSGTPLSDSVKREMPRSQYLPLLFNAEDARLKAPTQSQGIVYAEQVRTFINDVTEAAHPIRLARQPQLYAQVDYKVWQGQKKDTLRVYLKKFYTADSAAYWQVIGVQKPRRLLLPEVKTTAHTDSVRHEHLAPNAQDVSFLPLLRGVIAAKSLLQFAPDTLKPDADWKAVEAALRQDKLTIETAVKTTIYLNTKHGWVVQLGEFLREKDNSGWLITNLFEASQQATLPPAFRAYLKPNSK